MERLYRGWRRHPPVHWILQAVFQLKSKNEPDPAEEASDQRKAEQILATTKMPQWLGVRLGPDYAGRIKTEVST